MALLPVEQALSRILEGVVAVRVEQVPLLEARGRTLAEPLAAKFFAASVRGLGHGWLRRACGRRGGCTVPP